MKVIEFLECSDFEYREPIDNIRNCPSCGQRLKFISKSKPRHVLSLIGYILVISKMFECVNESCCLKGEMADPDSLGLPGKKYAKDLLKELIILKYCNNLSINKTIEEIQRRFNIILKESTVKRSIRQIEDIIISNSRCYMEKALKDKEFIGLALDYMEPKSKKHKVFCGFIIGSKSILLFETLDGKGETNIKHLIETQAKFCKENIKLYMSDADTTLIYYTDEDRTKGVNHLCSVHFLNLSYILGQDEDKLIMKEIKTCLQYIWEQFKRAENIKKRNSTLETLPTNLIAYNKNLLETIDIIEKSKGQRNESYASLNAYEKLEDLITVLDKLDETTLDIPKLLIHKNSLPIVKFRKKVENKTKPLRYFIHLIKKQSNIINNTSISKEETLKSLDKIFNIKDLEYEYEELNRKSGKYSIKRKYQKKYNYLFNQSKKKYLKYRDKIANAKDFNLKDMTNNLCENSFSFFRIWFRKLIGSRNHSDREYLEYLPFFHLQNDIDSNISLRLLFTKHIQRYNRIHDVSLHNLDIYKRFHYPQKRFSSLLTNMEVVGESSP